MMVIARLVIIFLKVGRSLVKNNHIVESKIAHPFKEHL
jgi:hypothetical protein